MIHKSRGLKRRRNTDKWEVTLALKRSLSLLVSATIRFVKWLFRAVFRFVL